MEHARVTRGHGLLEGFLAKQRSKMANKLISAADRQGRILDMGCGSSPFFLLNTDFSEKFGLDKVIEKDHKSNLQDYDIFLVNYDLEKVDRLPFDNDYFNVVTMLAVFEHIEPERLITILQDVNRVLKPDGTYILTTPSKWADGLLRSMAKLKLVSSVEIEEHKDVYTPAKIRSILGQANFSEAKLRLGYFEMFLNIWATATKSQETSS
jgi:2-polyprenyl-3-methyl-5-hydroxy-6-metoxy-1,4-benzoquinol methylase